MRNSIFDFHCQPCSIKMFYCHHPIRTKVYGRLRVTPQYFNCTQTMIATVLSPIEISRRGHQMLNPTGTCNSARVMYVAKVNSSIVDCKQMTKKLFLLCSNSINSHLLQTNQTQFNTQPKTNQHDRPTTKRTTQMFY